MRAKRLLGLRSARLAHTGALSIIQRADAALQLDPHPHTLAIDGVFLRDGGRLVFHHLGPPTVEEVHEVALRTALRASKLIARFGLDPDLVAMPERAADLDPALSAMLSASAQGLDLLSGQPALRLLDTPPTLPTSPQKHLVAEVMGINVHAQTWVHGHDRAGIERLVRYVARPPVCNDRLSVLDSGHVQYALKKPWRDGTTAVLLDPMDFIARLCALVPPPYFNTTRYNGVLASNSKLRREVVRSLVLSLPPPGEQLPLPLELPEELHKPWRPRPEPTAPRKTRTAGRHPWAYLLERTFRTVCPRCAGPLRLVEIATTPDAIRRVMTRAGLAPMPPPEPLPRIRAQLSLDLQSGT